MKDTGDLIDRELIKIEAVADVMIVLSGTQGLEQNTLAALGVIIQEAAENIRKLLETKGEGQ